MEHEIILKYFGKNTRVTVENITAKCNYIPPLFYQYFKNKIDIIDYSRNNILDEETIIKNINKVQLDYSFINKKYSIDFLNEIYDKLTLNEKELVCYYQNLNIDFLNRHKDDISWESISKNQNLSLDFIKENRYLISFNHLSLNKYLTNEIYMNFKDEINLNNYLVYNSKNYNKELILNNLNCINSAFFNHYLDLDDDFFNKHKNKINWNIFFILPKTKISEKFILDNINKIDFNNFNNYHLLSDEALIKIQNQINYDLLSRTKNLSDNIINTFKDRLSWRSLVGYINLPYEQLIKYKNYINEFLFIYLSSNKNSNFQFILENNKSYDLSQSLNLPDNYFRFNYKKLSVSQVLKNNRYSVDFLRRMQHVLPIYYILKHQNIPTEFANYLEMNALK